MFKNLPYRKIFCIGIGGIGVSGLAELLHCAGYEVSGSDVSMNQLTARLATLGVTVFSEHAADHVKDADLVVYTSAVREQNPEMQAARAAGIPALSRGEVLSRVMQANHNIIVTGTHGKTTTTALTSFLFENAGVDPTSLIGGVMQGRQSPFRLGSDDYFIAEADESDASFLFLSPTVAIITNIDSDHMETYAHDFEKLKQSFLKVTQKIPVDGFVVACMDDPVVRQLLPQMECRVLTYGTDPAADYQLIHFEQNGLESSFEVRCGQHDILPVKLHLPGIHNALNAVAAIATAHQLQCDLPRAIPALANFPGVGRRFQFHGEIQLPEKGAALLFDDYGHHPREIRATLKAARSAWPTRRLVLIFQPHRYSRTRDLMTDFVDVLKDADHLILTEVYAASEQRIAGADGQALFQLILQAGGKNIQYVTDLAVLPAQVRGVLKHGDIVILQGAGNIVTMARELLTM